MKTFTLAIRITAVVALSLLMVQCGNKQAAPNQSVSDDTTISSYGDKLPIAYINVDSLLSKYNYAKDLNEKMINKQENARASINEKARQLKKEQDDFQRKYQNNAKLSAFEEIYVKIHSFADSVGKIFPFFDRNHIFLSYLCKTKIM